MIGGVSFLSLLLGFDMQDQYVNHIMNETGATVLLRGRGSANPESALGEGSSSTPMILKNLSLLYFPRYISDELLSMCFGRWTATIAFILVE